MNFNKKSGYVHLKFLLCKGVQYEKNILCIDFEITKHSYHIDTNWRWYCQKWAEIIREIILFGQIGHRNHCDHKIRSNRGLNKSLQSTIQPVIFSINIYQSLKIFKIFLEFCGMMPFHYLITYMISYYEEFNFIFWFLSHPKTRPYLFPPTNCAPYIPLPTKLLVQNDVQKGALLIGFTFCLSIIWSWKNLWPLFCGSCGYLKFSKNT